MDWFQKCWVLADRGSRCLYTCFIAHIVKWILSRTMLNTIPTLFLPCRHVEKRKHVARSIQMQDCRAYDIGHSSILHKLSNIDLCRLLLETNSHLPSILLLFSCTLLAQAFALAWQAKPEILSSGENRWRWLEFYISLFILSQPSLWSEWKTQKDYIEGTPQCVSTNSHQELTNQSQSYLLGVIDNIGEICWITRREHGSYISTIFP